MRNNIFANFREFWPLPHTLNIGRRPKSIFAELYFREKAKNREISENFLLAKFKWSTVPMTNQRDLRITTSHGTVMTYLHQNRRQWGRSLGIHLPEGSPTTLHIILSLTLHELWNYDRYTSNFVITTGHHRLADMWFSMDRHHLLLNHYPCLDFLKLL